MPTVSRRGPAIKGIVGASRALGVGHSHCWRVLRGFRQSEPLVRRAASLTDFPEVAAVASKILRNR